MSRRASRGGLATIPRLNGPRALLRKVVAFLLLLMLAAKTAAMIARGPVPLERDAMGYWHLSTLVMNGDLLMLGEPIAYRTPLYPWFLGLIRVFAGTDSLWMISVIQGCLAVASIAVASRIAVKLTRLPVAGLLTCAVSLPAISAWTFFSTVLSETLFAFFLLVHLLAVLGYCEGPSTGKAVWAGMSLALALLTRPIVLLLWVPHLILLATLSRHRGQTVDGFASRNSLRPIRKFGHIVAAAATVAVCCGPWLVRNDHLFGQPFLTEFLGRNLWIVAFQDESGSGHALPQSDAGNTLQRRLNRVGAADQWQATWGVSNGLVRSGLSDAQADRLMKEVAIASIQTNPRDFLYKTFRRSVNFWRCAATELPEPGATMSPSWGQRTWGWSIPSIEWVVEHRVSRSVIVNTLLMFLMASCLVVLLINPTSRWYGLWLSMILAYFAIITGLFEIPAYRYRMVVEPIVALVVGSALAILLSRRRLEVMLVPTTRPDGAVPSASRVRLTGE